MIYTFGDAKEYCAQYVKNGRKSTDPVVAATIEEAIELLIAEGSYKGTEQRIRLRTYNQCVALPHNVETIEKVAVDSTVANVWSKAYEFLDGGPGPFSAGRAVAGKDLVDLGDNWATFFPIGVTPRKIIAMSDDVNDAFSEMRIRGLDDMAMEIKPSVPGEMLKISPWAEGAEGTISYEDLQISSNYFTEITSVVKPVTAGHVSLYAYDPATYGLWLLSKYAPYETQPGYRRYKITNTNLCNEECIQALVKMRHVKMQHDSDVLIIQSLPALKLMCKAINQYDHGEQQLGLNFQAQAQKILDNQLGNAEPENNEFDIQVQGSFGDIPEVI